MPRSAGVAPDKRPAQFRCSIHEPNRGLAIVVLPENVGLAVAVEIAGAFDVPCRTRIAAHHSSGRLRGSIDEPGPCPAVIVLPQDVGLAVAVEIGGAFRMP